MAGIATLGNRVRVEEKTYMFFKRSVVVLVHLNTSYSNAVVFEIVLLW